jgi:hypothetical protein
MIYLCGAHRHKNKDGSLRGTDGLCHKRVAAAGLRCKLHGGKSLSGMASPTYKGPGKRKGRTWARHLPTRLMEQHADGMSEPDRQHFLNDELSALDILLDAELQKINSGLVDTRVQALKALAEKVLLALRAGDYQAATAAAEELHDCTRAEVREFAATDRALRIMAHKTSTAAEQRKNLASERGTMTVEQAQEFCAVVMRAVVETARLDRVTFDKVLRVVYEKLGGTVPVELEEQATPNRLKAIAAAQNGSEVQTPDS